MTDKICERCGRKIEYRKKWARNWDSIKYCGEKCRRAKSHSEYRSKILELLDQRERGATICPSEVLPEADKKNPELMEAVRREARLLVEEGTIQITQKGKVVDPSDFRGPIRLRKKT